MELFKIRNHRNSEENPSKDLIFWCEGCKGKHVLNSKKFSFKVSPEGLLYTDTGVGLVKKDQEGNISICRFMITDNIITYESNCTHSKKSQSIPLINLETAEEKSFGKIESVVLPDNTLYPKPFKGVA